MILYRPEESVNPSASDSGVCAVSVAIITCPFLIGDPSTVVSFPLNVIGSLRTIEDGGLSRVILVSET